MAKIDIYDCASYPSELKEMKREFFLLLDNGVIKNFEDCDHFMDYLVKAIYSNTENVLSKIKKRLEYFFLEHEIICLHNTRLMCKDKVLKEGLIFPSNGYVEYMQEVLAERINKKYVKEIVDKIKEIIEEFEKDPFCNKANQISLYINSDFCKNYDAFYSQFGGEILSTVIRNLNYDESLKNKILNFGDPYTVKISCPFDNIVDYKKDDIVLEVLRYWFELNKNLHPSKTNGCDVYINQEISRNNIIDIIAVVEE